MQTEKKLRIFKTAVIAGLVLLFVAFTYLAIGGYFAKRQTSNSEIIPNSETPISSAKETADSLATAPEIKLLFLGDIMMARNIGYSITLGKNPFVNVEPTFKNYDLVVGNLETNVSEPGISHPASGKPYVFNSPVKSLDLLKQVGIGMVSLANNHTMDYYANGLANQIDLLDSKKIIHFGAGKNINDAYEPKFVIIKDTKVAFIAFNDIENWQTNPSATTAGSAYFNDDYMQTAVKTAAEKADVVIVYPHWGLEYYLQHDSRQEKYAKLFIDWGADIVIGAHPHVVQDVGEYNGKKIYYSLGNFLFDGMYYIPNASDSIMLEVKIQDNQIQNSTTIPVRLNIQGWPELK